MRIVCRHDTDHATGRGATTVVRLRRRGASEADALRAVIERARAGERRDVSDGDPPLFALARGFSSGGRALARAIVGVGTVVVILGAVIAFVSPSVAGSVLGFVVLPASVAIAVTVAVAWTHDTGLTIHRDGRMRTEGWRGIRELDLRSFADVTVTSSGR